MSQYMFHNMFLGTILSFIANLRLLYVCFFTITILNQDVRSEKSYELFFALYFNIHFPICHHSSIFWIVLYRVISIIQQYRLIKYFKTKNFLFYYSVLIKCISKFNLLTFPTKIKLINVNQDLIILLIINKLKNLLSLYVSNDGK